MKRDELIGRVLDKYTLLRHLGSGGNGSVYLAREVNPRLAIPRLFAVKTFRETQGAIGHLLDEARIATSLDHPNVVRLHEFNEHDGLWFFGMDFVAGESLFNVMRAIGRLPEREAWAWPASLVASACRGLQHAHDRQIVHRDIKPGNLMVRYDGNVLVVDFGIAKAAKQQNVHTGMFRGTPAYMSPEQISEQGVDPRSDLFSLGTVLYELCTRTRLFHRRGFLDIAHAITREDVERPRARAPAIPKPLEEIIMSMLAREKENRVASAAEVERSLRELLLKEQFPDYDGHRYMRTLFGDRIEHMERIMELAKTADPLDPRLAQAQPKIISARAPRPVTVPPQEPHPEDDELQPRDEKTDEAPSIQPSRAQPPPVPTPSISAFDAGTTLAPAERTKARGSSRAIAAFIFGLLLLGAAIAGAVATGRRRGPEVTVLPVQEASPSPGAAVIEEPAKVVEDKPVSPPVEKEPIAEEPIAVEKASEEKAAEPPKTRMKTAEVPKGPGRVSVALNCAGEFRTGTVLIDNREQEAPLEIEIPSGTHRVEARTINSGTVTRVIRVKPNQTTPVALDVCGAASP